MAAMLVDLGMAGAVVLAAVFAWAGAAKLGRLADTAAGFADLGLPWSSALARGMPVLELSLAVLLLVVPGVGGGVALLLLGGFSAVLLRALRRGVVVRCACFGRGDGPLLSWVEVLRNGLLGAPAVLALFAGTKPQFPGWAAVAAMLLGTAAGAVLLGIVRRRGV